jgi:phosphatidylethanolamine N-methyltransferase
MRSAQAEAISVPSLTQTSSNIEYYNKALTKLFRGNSLYGCYALGAAIFSLGIFRDVLCVAALSL